MLENLSKRREKLAKDFHEVETVVAGNAERMYNFAASLKVLLIFPGAFTATKEVASQLIGASNAVNTIVYTMVGLLVAVTAGLEAAFKWESRSTELKILTANCYKNTLLVETLRLKIAELEDEEQILQNGNHILNDDELKAEQEKRYPLEKLLDDLEAALSQIQQRAAELGINVSYEIAQKKRQNRL